HQLSMGTRVVGLEPCLEFGPPIAVITRGARSARVHVEGDDQLGNQHGWLLLRQDIQALPPWLERTLPLGARPRFPDERSEQSRGRGTPVKAVTARVMCARSAKPHSWAIRVTVT